MKICEFCKREVEGLTKHSIMGNHKTPFVLVCRNCHDSIHGMVRPKLSKKKNRELKSFLLNKLKNKGYDIIDLPINSNKGLS